MDVIATMRWSNSGTPANSTKKWAVSRRTLVKQASILGSEGYKVYTGKKLPVKTYKQLLLDTKIGFIWSASAYLGWKIPEFTQTGVIMITEPLGNDYPLINNVIFEHEKHCIFESNPNNFNKIAKSLLKHPNKMKELRKYILNLWESKLAPMKVGEYYYKTLKKGFQDEDI